MDDMLRAGAAITRKRHQHLVRNGNASNELAKFSDPIWGKLRG